MKLTKSDILKKKEKIEEYNRRLAGMPITIDDAKDDELGYGYRPNQMIQHESRSLLYSLIKKEEEDIREAEIIDELEIPENVVGLGDTVTLLMQFDGEEPFENEVLVSDIAEFGLSSVTTSSPVGMAIYGKNIGSVVNCKTPKGQLTITILEKSHGLKR